MKFKDYMQQLSLFENNDKKLITLKEASIWASEYLKRITTLRHMTK